MIGSSLLRPDKLGLQIAESECEEMKSRLRSMHDAAEQKEATLKKYEACLAQQ